MPKKVLAEIQTPNGPRRIIRWDSRAFDLQQANFGCPQKIGEKASRDLSIILAHFIEHGVFPNNDTKFKRLKGDLFEVKAWKYRLYGYFDNSNMDFILVHCVFKNKQKAGSENIKHGEKLIARAKNDMEFI